MGENITGKERDEQRHKGEDPFDLLQGLQGIWCCWSKTGEARVLRSRRPDQGGSMGLVEEARVLIL